MKIKLNGTEIQPVTITPHKVIDLEFLDDAGNPVNDINLIATNSNLSFMLTPNMDRQVAVNIITAMLEWGETHRGTQEDFGRWLDGQSVPRPDPLPIPQNKTHPLGKGMLIWRIENIYSGDVVRMAAVCKELGCAWVSLKIAEADKPFMDDKGKDWLPSAVKALREVGISVHGWQYAYGAKPEAEAKIAVQRMKDFGLDGFQIDAEAEYKSVPDSNATRYMQVLKEGLAGLPIGLCAYRYPTYHQELPWKEFLAGGVTYHAPQVYWEQSHNPGTQLKRAVKELKALKDIPIVPIGSVYSVGNWSPTVNDLKEFSATVKELALPGIGWYALHSLVNKPDWYSEIRGQVWK